MSATGKETAMTRLTGKALRVTVFIGENDTWHRKPLYSQIVHRARAAGLAGASVFRGIEGFGASSLIHTTRLLSLSEDLPVAVVIVDTEERVRAFLPELDELVGEGMVILDSCEVIRYVGREEPAGAPGDTGGKGKKSL
jgi:PII-like signaling protein